MTYISSYYNSNISMIFILYSKKINDWECILVLAFN